MRVKKEVIAALPRFASDVRYGFARIEPGRAWATDGYRLLVVPMEAAPEGVPALGPCSLKASALREAVQGLPTGKHAPVPEVASIVQPLASFDANGAVVIRAGAAQVTVPKIDASVPAIDKIIPQGEPVLCVGVNAKFLAEACKALASLQPTEHITLEFYAGKNAAPGTVKADPLRAFVIRSAGGAFVVQMPMSC